GDDRHLRRFPPHGDGEPPSWNKVVPQARECAHRVVEEHESPATNHRIERAERQRHGLRVPFHELDGPYPSRPHALARYLQHLRRLVNRHHGTTRASLSRRSHRWFTDPRRHVEDLVSWRDVSQLHHPITEGLRPTLKGDPTPLPA